MSRNHRSHPDSSVFAVLHRAGKTWRVLIARKDNGRLEILETRRFATEDAADIQSYLDGQKTGRVITVLPSSSVVCRTCTLPDAAPDVLAQALNLQAETHLLDTTEAHRVASSVLEIAPGETSRTGIIVSWPEDSAAGSAVSSPVSQPNTYAPDVAALAALLNGYRPAEPLFWVDRPSGSVALSLTHPGGAVIRATREEGDSTEEWMKNTTRVLAETALSVGHNGAFAQSLVESHRPHLARIGEDGATLVVPREVIDGVGDAVIGTESTDEWWAEFGIAAGVAIASTGDLVSLTRLEGARAIETPSRLESITRALSQPRTALITAIVGLAIIALLPLAASGLRLTILRTRFSEIEQQTQAIGQTESRLAMYTALEKQTWSMTKLLADVVSNTPQGIELDSIRLQHSDESVFVSGGAVSHGDRTATEVIALMQEEMRDSGLFGEIRLNWDEGTKLNHHKFELSAKITAPHRRVKYAIEHDYGQWTLAQRQGGEGPSSAGSDAIVDASDAATTPAPTPEAKRPARTAGADVDAADTSTPTRDRGGVRPSVGAIGDVAEGAADRSDLTDRGTRNSAAGAVPAPLTAEQIAAMSTDQISAALVDVAKAKNRIRPEDDPELYERLAKEFSQLMARRREGL